MKLRWVFELRGDPLIHDKLKAASTEDLEDCIEHIDGLEFRDHLRWKPTVQSILDNRRFNTSLAVQRDSLEETAKQTRQNTTPIKLAWLGIAVAIALGMASLIVALFR